MKMMHGRMGEVEKKLDVPINANVSKNLMLYLIVTSLFVTFDMYLSTGITLEKLIYRSSLFGIQLISSA